MDMENHHFESVNQLFLWQCSSSQTVKLPAGTVLAVLAIYFCVIVDFGHVNGIFNKDPPVTAGRTRHLAQLCRATHITRAASCRLRER